MEFKRHEISKSIWRTPKLSFFPHSSYISYDWDRKCLMLLPLQMKQDTWPQDGGKVLRQQWVVYLFFFFRAVREALQKVGPTSFGKTLDDQKLIKLMSFALSFLTAQGYCNVWHLIDAQDTSCLDRLQYIWGRKITCHRQNFLRNDIPITAHQ